MGIHKQAINNLKGTAKIQHEGAFTQKCWQIRFTSILALP
jgi:hypothetical protein